MIAPLLDPAVRDRLYLLLGFEPDADHITQVRNVVQEHGWREDAYILAALYCHLMGGEVASHRAAEYAIRGGFNPADLGIVRRSPWTP